MYTAEIPFEEKEAASSLIIATKGEHKDDQRLFLYTRLRKSNTLVGKPKHSGFACIGYSKLNHEQEQVILVFFSGKDVVFLALPTGYGPSLVGVAITDKW